MKDSIKSLKDLCLEIVNSENTRTDAWLKTTAKLYEQLLLADYLEKRNAALKTIESNLVQDIGKVIEAKPIEIKQPKAAKPALENMAKEIREVPIPQGPPVSNIQDSIYDAPKTAVEEKPADKVLEVEIPTKVEVVEEVEMKVAPATLAPPKPATTNVVDSKVSIAEKAATAPKKSVNDMLSGSSLKFGLNDRIAFVKHLFNGSQEDFNRVVSQLNTFTNQQEALDFVEHIVKPEYNWKSKEEFADRFMESLENRYA